jgi:hypothetical protein
MLSILNLLGYILVVTVNALANILPLNGQQTGEISNRLEVLFTPAGYVFAIWSLIYILLGIWVFRQFSSERKMSNNYRQVSLLFILSCVLNAFWIFCWHYNWFGLSVIVMIGLLITLIFIYLNIKKAEHKTLDLLPFSVYLGWISVATVANISYFLKYIDWSGWGLSPITWTVIMIVVATMLAATFFYREHDIAYVLVFIWALVGIAVADAEIPVLFSSALAGAFTLTAIILIFGLTKRKKRLNS